MGFEDDDESGDGWVDIFDSSLTDFGAICRELFGGNYTPDDLDESENED